MTDSPADRKGVGNSPVDQNLIRELADLLKETDLSEIEIEQQGLRLRVVRQLAAVTAVAPVASAAPQPAATHSPHAVPEAAKHPGAVTSPMVGTIYLAPEPNAPPFIRVGDSVAEGQTLVIVEAMKTMNHIPAPRAGKITEILVQNGQPVEFGEPLVVIE